MDYSVYSIHGRFWKKIVALSGFLLILTAAAAQSVELTLDQAVGMAVGQSSRSGIIRGKEEVARQRYSAKRLNFLLPEISINGQLPAYATDQSYRFFGGASAKSLYETKDLEFNSNIQLRQSVPVTGGSFVATANLSRADNRYPVTGTNFFTNEISKRGFFNFSLEQQLFRPSEAKNELKNLSDDLELARYTRHEEKAALEKEVIEAYIGNMQGTLKLEIQSDKIKAAELKTSIDSLKMMDGILSEDDYMLSVSERLDAQLAGFEVETEAAEINRELAILVEVDVSETIITSEPVVPENIDSTRQRLLIAGWESSVPIRKAEHTLEKARRSAKFQASGYGLTGDLKAHYSIGQQNVDVEINDESLSQDVNTSGWGVSLEVKLPLWDGGAGKAAVRAAEFEVDQAQLEHERERRKARAEIMNLINQINVSYRRLDILHRQIDLASDKLDIALFRFEDGQISELTYLESKIFYKEAREKYLEELKKYLTNRVELESKYLG